MKFGIPIYIVVEANNEEQAEQQCFDFLKNAQKEFGSEQRVLDWEYMEFLPEDGEYEYDEEVDSNKHSIGRTLN